MERAMDHSNSAVRRIDTEVLKGERPLADVVDRALCPFHQERTPSFWIDARKATNEHHYYCFGCGASGDVITFVMQREGCLFQEACERLSTRGRPPLVEPTPHAATRSKGRRWEELDPNSAEAEVLEVALQVYEERLWLSRSAHAYLRTRAVPEELARAERLGYADGHALLQRLRRDSPDGKLLQVAVALGLVLERPDAADGRLAYREFFFDRLIIPELRKGRPIWCIGRAVEDATSTESVAAPDAPMAPSRRPRPKYLGLPGEKPVLGLDHVAGRGVAYLVEGPFDLLAAVGWGLPAFAICGTHFPTERLPALAEAVAVYGVFDPDRAGTSAAERFGPLFGSRWRPLCLPNGLDLAELAALGDHGRQMFDVLVGRARAGAWQQGRL
jgi:DNA primase